MIRFLEIANVDPGFDTSNTLTMSIALNWTRYSEPHQRLAFVDRTIEQIRACLPAQRATKVKPDDRAPR